MDNSPRVVEILVNGRWEKIEFRQLKKHDIFRMFEKDGTPVDDGEISLATGNAQLSDNCHGGFFWVCSRPAGRIPNERDAASNDTSRPS